MTLALGSYTAPATLITRTAPAMEEAAYLVAELAPPPACGRWVMPTCTATAPFVGTGRIDFAAATSANGTSSLAFGRDELVTVRAEPVLDLTGSAGFTGSRVERRTRRAYTVENRHKTPRHAAGAARRAPVAQREDRGRIALPTPAHRPGLEPQPRHRGLAAAAGCQGHCAVQRRTHHPLPQRPGVARTPVTHQPDAGSTGCMRLQVDHNPSRCLPQHHQAPGVLNMSYQHILVAVDGSPTSNHAVTGCGPGQGIRRPHPPAERDGPVAHISGFERPEVYSQEVLPACAARARRCCSKHASA